MFSSYLNAQHIFENLTPGLPESFRILTLFDKKFQSLWKPQVLGQYVFASEYFDLHILVLSETTPSFAESAI